MARSSALRWGRAALVLALAACHSAGPLPRTARPRFVDLTGKLQLIDARPVPRATLAVACGKVRLTVTTDSKGRFALPGVPEGTCRISCPLANIDQEVRASANLIGRTAGVDLVLTVPPMHRMEIKVAGGGWAMDETLVAWIPPAIDRGDLLRRTPRPWMPLAFRNAPRGGEMGKIPLLDPDRHLTTLDLSAPRTALYLAPCNKSGSKIALDLQRLVESHAATGLRGVAIQTRPCRQGQPLPSNALAGSAEVTRGFVVGNLTLERGSEWLRERV